MRHKPRFNFPAFFAAEAALRRLGWRVFNPARMDVEAGVATRGGRLRRGHGDFGPEDARAFARRDVGVLLNRLRAERGDAVVLLPGWRRSVGARAENAIARWVGLRRLSLKKALLEGNVG
jgi:hypothetical protein